MRHTEQVREPTNLVLSPINPFTPRQRDIINKQLEGRAYKQGCVDLGIKLNTYKGIISGCETSTTKVMFSNNFYSIGILGVIERFTGKRPFPETWLARLLGDVIVAESTLSKS